MQEGLDQSQLGKNLGMPKSKAPAQYDILDWRLLSGSQEVWTQRGEIWWAKVGQYAQGRKQGLEPFSLTSTSIGCSKSCVAGTIAAKLEKNE